VTAAPIVEAPAAPAPAPPERPALTLVGTIIGGGDKIAIFFNTSSRAVVRLRLGESDNGWVLRSVGARETVLETDRSSFTLALPAPDEARPRPGQPPGADEQL
jgi:general secretion pathway protein N